MIQILELMRSVKTAAIAGHVRPDGDCAGSCLALYRYLKQNTDAEVTVYLEQLSGSLAELPGAEAVVTVVDTTATDASEIGDLAGSSFATSVSSNAAADAEAIAATSSLAAEVDNISVRSKYVSVTDVPSVDLMFVLDCSDTERLGAAKAVFDKAAKTVCIDHHATNLAFAGENFVVPDASSTSELIFSLLDEEKIDQEMAECLYTGILHDTGVFHHSCTSARTMEIAGKLMEKGVDFPALIDEGFYQKTYIQNQILGRCLMESLLLWEGLGIVSYLTRSVMDFYDVKPSDLGGIIDQLRLTKGVEVAIFLYETEEPRSYKVSMRANGDVDVSRVAAYFGGGGHVKAAGCTMKGTVHDVINNLTGQIEYQLKQLGKV